MQWQQVMESAKEGALVEELDCTTSDRGKSQNRIGAHLDWFDALTRTLVLQLFNVYVFPSAIVIFYFACLELVDE